ncbi:MAG: PilZ domain-containing protein [Candidatus Lindowbacteria bacterium]|nr:PilZ domain-containing protein [Candidatus Lindowbacteria bacterium]
MNVSLGEASHSGAAVNVSAGGILISVQVGKMSDGTLMNIEDLEQGCLVQVSVPDLGVVSVRAMIVHHRDPERRTQTVRGSWGNSVGIRFLPPQTQVATRLLDKLISNL